MLPRPSTTSSLRLARSSPRSAWSTREPSGSWRSSRPSGPATTSSRPSGSQPIENGMVVGTVAITSAWPPGSTARTSCAPQLDSHRRPSCQRADSPIFSPVSRTSVIAVTPRCRREPSPSTRTATVQIDTGRRDLSAPARIRAWHHRPVSSPSIEQGRAALHAGDAATARRVFELALAEGESGDALEGLGEALYLQCDYPAAAAYYERAYAAFRRERDLMAAGRAARTVAWISGNVLGDWAVRSGRLARASAILEEAGEDGPERGWVLMIRAFSEPDAQVRESLLREAIAIGRRFGDPDIEFLAVAYLGSLYLLVDRVEEGLALSDEAMAALLAGELTEVATVDEIFCGLFWGCELVNDVPRADQWIRAATERMRRSNVVAAFCRAHYGGILTAAGRWDQAEVELLEAARQFDRGRSPRRDAAIIRLADLRVRQARLEEAARLLEGLEHHPDAVRALAALRLARGEVALARDLLERVTDTPDDEVPTVGEFTMMGPL